MSNQVYSNQTQKYYPLPGINTYDNLVEIPIGDALSGTGVSTVPRVVELSCPHTSLEQIAGFTHQSAITGRVIIDVEGMYSITGLANVLGAPTPATVDIDGSLALVLRDTGDGNSGFAVDNMSIKASAPGISAGNINRHFSVHFVGYLKAGTSIAMDFSNYAASAATVLPGSAQFKVGKLF